MLQTGERADARANRARIIAAAREVFAEQGLDAEVREICARSGVGMGTLYRNFATKDDLIAALICEITAEFSALFDDCLARPDPREGLLTLLSGIWTLADRHGDIVRALRSHHVVAEARRASEKSQTRLKTLIERGREAGVVQSDLSPEFASAYLNALFGVYLDTRAALGPARAAANCTAVFIRAVMT